MAVVKNLMVRAGADFSALRRETEKAQRVLNNFKSNTERTMGALRNALIALGIGKVIKDSIQSAMSVESSIQQLNRIMGQNSNAFQKWANEQAIAFNMSKQEALKYGAIYGNLISGFTKSTGETMKYTEDLLKSSAIVASATGRSMEDVMERIRSGMLGNTEAIEDLGINVNVAMIESTNAFKRFAGDRSWKQLDFQTQQQIRLFAILEQSSKKYGDAVNQNTSSQLQQLVAQLKNVQLSLGQAFLPIVQIVLPILTALASKLAYIMSIVAQFSQALFGKAPQQQAQAQAKATTQQASAVGDLGKALKKTGKEAKKAQGNLAGFDEINSLSKKADSGGGDSEDNSAGLSGAGGGAMPVNFDTNAPEISGKIQAMAELVKARIKEIRDTIVSNKEIIISVVGGIVSAFTAFKAIEFMATIPALLSVIKASLTLLLGPVGLISAAVGVLVGSFLYLYQTSQDFKNKVNNVWNETAKIMSNFVNSTLKPMFSYIVNDFLKPLGIAFKVNILPVLADIFVGMGNIFNDILRLLQTTIDNLWGILRPAFELIKTIVKDVLEIIKALWDKYGQDIINNVRAFIEGLKSTFQLIWDKVINPIIKPALEMLTWLWSKHLKGLVQEVGAFVAKCINGALELYNGFIKPVIDKLISKLGPAFSSTVAFIVDILGSMLASVADITKGLIKTLGGIIDFLVGVFTGNWKKAWEGVKGIFKGIFDSLVGIVKTPLNYIIDAINTVIRGLSKISIKTPDWLPGDIGGKSFGISIPTIPKLAQGGYIGANSPLLAMVGDNRNEGEIVAPESKIYEQTFKAIRDALGSSSGGQPIILKVGETEIARAVARGINSIQRQTGELILDI